MSARTHEALLEAWRGPYGGVPPFDRVRIAELEPALQAAMAEELVEIERIAANPEAPTFDNTLAALERCGRPRARIERLFGIYTTTLNTPEVQAIERVVAPRLAAHADRITQHEALFRRIDAVYASRTHAGLTAEQQRLAWFYRTQFAHHGAQLEPPAKQRLSELNQRLAELYTSFSQRLLADEEGHWLELASEADLAGLPDSARSAFAASARARGVAAPGIVLNTRSSVELFLEHSARRDLRARVFDTFVRRGDRGDAHDTWAVIAEILRLRGARARLLGFRTHAHWRLEDSMAKTPEAALALMESVWPAAVARVREEVADMQAVADAEQDAAGQPRRTIAPWDYRYYAEQVRRARFDLDAGELTAYLQLERLREGAFWVAGRLFGLTFREVPAGRVPLVHPDVRVFAVTGADDAAVGLWYFDPYARPYKLSGAWMSEYRLQERFAGEVTAIVSNNANFVPGEPGAPLLISWSDAVTLFHEFGHALHGLLSAVNYPSLSGTNVARDYVEFPSQLFEHWLSTPEVLTRFACHHRSGEPMPAALVERIQRAATFNEGFATVEYLASALVDLRLHLATEPDLDPCAFERDTLARLGMPAEVVMRHRTPQFQHVFAGDGYSAGYYSYLWSDTLSADAWEAFAEAGGPYDPAVAERLRRAVFAAGNTADPAAAYRAFRGRDPRVGALMRQRGFPEPAAAQR